MRRQTRQDWLGGDNLIQLDLRDGAIAMLTSPWLNATPNQFALHALQNHSIDVLI